MFKILVTVLLLTTSVLADTKMKIITDSFNDKVKLVKETDQGIKLHFEIHAAVYKINKNNPKFEQLKKLLEKSLKENKEVKVEVLVPSMEITSVNN
ncbi:MAG: hypothetical protein PHY93_17885 [Bacteriovorax sp.]|nr:hypothetical protein [Bacteriovorax sp.]